MGLQVVFGYAHNQNEFRTSISTAEGDTIFFGYALIWLRAYVLVTKTMILVTFWLRAVVFGYDLVTEAFWLRFGFDLVTFWLRWS